MTSQDATQDAGIQAGAKKGSGCQSGTKMPLLTTLANNMNKNKQSRAVIAILRAHAVHHAPSGIVFV